MRGWGKLTAVAIVLLLGSIQAVPAYAAEGSGKETALKASDMTGKIFPEKVFFRGQVAPVQMRNTGGIHFADDMYVLTGLVDNSGYSSDIRQKYQAYFISEVALEVGGQKLPAGAYGVGFLKDNKFVVMDLGAHDLFQTDSAHDADMKRPVPLQVVPSSAGGSYRLYAGRDYVEIKRAQ